MGRELLDVLRGQHDVAVVGQDDQLPVAGAVDRGEDVLNARVHCLAALHNSRAEAAEDLLKTVASRHGDHTNRRCRLILTVRRACLPRRRRERLVLQLHVLDFDLGQRAVIHRELQRLPGPRRVHVDAHQVVIADGDHRVAQLLHAGLHVRQRHIAIAQHELGAEAEGGLVVDRFYQRPTERPRGSRSRFQLDVNSAAGREHPGAFEDDAIALATRVDHARLAQHFELRGRGRHCIVGSTQRLLQKTGQIEARFSRGSGGRGRFARDRQDRAFDRTADAPIGRLAGLRQGLRQA